MRTGADLKLAARRITTSSMVDKPDLKKHQPSCNLAHDLVNKLSIIVGNSDLMKEKTEDSPFCRQRLQIIRSISMEMATALQHHQCDLEVLIRDAARKPVTRAQKLIQADSA
jgi:hypothetical protein